MWFKILYFLRIFKPTGYLIRMIFTVIYDMRFFFLVLLITLVAFGDSFYIISEANKDDNKFVFGFVDSILFSYYIILGNFDTGKFGNVANPVVLAIFLICTVFDVIVMFNLLIAIISETFARVNSIA